MQRERWEKQSKQRRKRIYSKVDRQRGSVQLREMEMLKLCGREQSRSSDGVFVQRGREMKCRADEVERQ